MSASRFSGGRALPEREIARSVPRERGARARRGTTESICARDERRDLLDRQEILDLPRERDDLVLERLPALVERPIDDLLDAAARRHDRERERE